MKVGYQYTPGCPDPLSLTKGTPGRPPHAWAWTVDEGYWYDGQPAYTPDVFPQKLVS